MVNKWRKISKFFLQNEQKIVLVVGFVLACGVSFELGLLQGQKWQQKPLIIEKPINIPGEDKTVKIDDSVTSNEGTGATQAATQTSKTGTTQTTAGCAFVGSKNSDKFYVPTCTWAKRIKPENLACYKSEQDALAKGKAKSECK